MKKMYFSLSILAAVLLLSTTISHLEKTAVFNSATAILSEEPLLPDVPYDYDIDFPQHISSNTWNTLDVIGINNKISPAGATLGRVLFYDKKLSASNEVACASCHKQEFSFADNVDFSEGIAGTATLRNSPNINDLSWSSGLFFEPNLTFLFWDARESNLEEMVLQPITHEGELGKDLDFLLEKLANTEYYAPLFQDAFGDPGITADRIGIALAQFVRSMSSFDTKFDRVHMGEATFTPAELAGFSLFQESCEFACHSAPHFGNAMPMNNGLEEIYTDEGVADWSGNEWEVGKFRSPSLRNIEMTGPYMHDGRFETLEEVIDFYSDDVFPHPNNDFFWVAPSGGQGFEGFDFTDTEKANLLAFLKTLTGQDLLSNVKWSDPFDPVSSTSYIPLEEPVHLFPNPVGESATIQLANADGARYNLRLTSIEGRVLRTFTTTASTVILQKDGLPSGIYLLEIRKGDRKKVERVVLQ